MRNVLLYLIFIKSIVCKPPLRIIGGRDAESDEYPYVVRIEIHAPITNLDNTKATTIVPLCTGSVLTPVWTISAAHCFHLNIQVRNNSISNGKLTAYSVEQYALVIGYGPINMLPSNAEVFSRINYLVKHQAYRPLTMKNDVKPTNDVALVRHQPISLKQYGRVAGLEFTTLTGHEVTIAGYGLTHDSQGELFATLVLQKPLQVLAGVVIQCPPNKLMYPALCIGRRCGHVIDSTCGGDSGGPVIHPAGIVAVVSKGTRCLPVQKAVPVDIATFATPLSPYIQWISDHIRDSL